MQTKNFNRLLVALFVSLYSVFILLAWHSQARPREAAEKTKQGQPAEISVHFSPHGGCTDEIVAEIATAKTSIDVLAYEFTSEPIAKALIAAAGRGVKVRIIVDRKASHSAKCQSAHCRRNGCQVWTDGKHAIAHNKVLLIDGQLLLTGSFNFSSGAEMRNAENMLTIRGHADLVRQYEANFAEHLKHSE